MFEKHFPTKMFLWFKNLGSKYNENQKYWTLFPKAKVRLWKIKAFSVVPIITKPKLWKANSNNLCLDSRKTVKYIQQLLLGWQHHLVCSGTAPKRSVFNFDLCLPLELKSSQNLSVLQDSCNLYYKIAVWISLNSWIIHKNTTKGNVKYYCFPLWCQDRTSSPNERIYKTFFLSLFLRKLS